MHTREHGQCDRAVTHMSMRALGCVWPRMSLGYSSGPVRVSSWMQLRARVTCLTVLVCTHSLIHRHACVCVCVCDTGRQVPCPAPRLHPPHTSHLPLTCQHRTNHQQLRNSKRHPHVRLRRVRHGTAPHRSQGGAGGHAEGAVCGHEGADTRAGAPCDGETEDHTAGYGYVFACTGRGHGVVGLSCAPASWSPSCFVVAQCLGQ